MGIRCRERSPWWSAERSCACASLEALRITQRRVANCSVLNRALGGILETWVGQLEPPDVPARVARLFTRSPDRNAVTAAEHRRGTSHVERLSFWERGDGKA